ncbi:hypothetical protein DRA42_07000 [Ethanoligenens harbinense]|nr:hypothetical protein CXQ68_06970 [Ethanoligenens harbinense YUAN-3]AYF38651.1 hypothetical protein CXP51_06840 [Ethanoligenens harbinense]AYF41398.1 hypothetical protein CN246_06980 [Ethanoligenens harbinense]QCN92231.1 hypothetical protein DRA42_07000 [Ethanoligenens harbinense]
MMRRASRSLKYAPAGGAWQIRQNIGIRDHGLALHLWSQPIPVMPMKTAPAVATLHHMARRLTIKGQDTKAARYREIQGGRGL